MSATRAGPLRQRDPRCPDVHYPDVRGGRSVPLARVHAQFPQGHVQLRRVPLAPPVARAVTQVHTGLCPVFNAVPLLRTHLLAWVAKPKLQG